MANITPSQILVHPNYMVPELLMQYNQASAAFEALAGGDPMPRLGTGDLQVYAKAFDVRTSMAAGQTAGNSLPSVDIIAKMISTPTYLQRVRAEYDHHDTAAMSNWGVNIVEAQRLGMRQGHFQLMRSALLYGMNGSNGEGLLNAVGATTVSLPADSFGNTTVSTYDNGQMAIFMLGVLGSLKVRIMQLGIGHRIVILGPQRVFAQWEYAGIVQLTQFQRPGAGTNTTAGTIKSIGEMNADEIVWGADDTLIGKGANGTDAVIVVLPEVKAPKANKVNTNVFAEVAPGLSACTLQYCDMPAPREIPTPLPGGAIDVLSEMRITSGWAVRPEAISIINMPF